MSELGDCIQYARCRGPAWERPRPYSAPGQLSLSVKCHAAIFSTSPRRGPPRLHLSSQPRVPTPELGPHSDLISHGRLLPALVTVLVGCDSCFLKQRWLPLSYASKGTGRAEEAGERPWLRPGRVRCGAFSWAQELLSRLPISVWPPGALRPMDPSPSFFRVLQATILGQLGAKLLRLARTYLLGRLSG